MMNSRGVHQWCKDAVMMDGPTSIIFINKVDSLCGSQSKGECDSACSCRVRRTGPNGWSGQEGRGWFSIGNDLCLLGLRCGHCPHFKKQFYIRLHEQEARSAMVKIHLGDTPNSLSECNLNMLGQGIEGTSTSKIMLFLKGV